MPADSHRGDRCTVPPTGWWCSREAGHTGPCAARPTLDEGSPAWDVAVDALVAELHAPEDYAQRVVRIVAEALEGAADAGR